MNTDIWKRARDSARRRFDDEPSGGLADDMPESLVRRAEAEADAIWASRIKTLEEAKAAAWRRFDAEDGEA